ncbi:hypothetical protein PEC301653_29870 [Pectobacterium carotovorum subsp. carotovorum]|nr:hypothetical protein PEC301653_29870 [Pectobacterium carotovorum subsp. carotovorum]
MDVLAASLRSIRYYRLAETRTARYGPFLYHLSHLGLKPDDLAIHFGHHQKMLLILFLWQ